MGHGTYSYLQMVRVFNLIVSSVTLGGRLMSFSKLHLILLCEPTGMMMKPNLSLKNTSQRRNESALPSESSLWRNLVMGEKRTRQDADLESSNSPGGSFGGNIGQWEEYPTAAPSSGATRARTHLTHTSRTTMCIEIGDGSVERKGRRGSSPFFFSPFLLWC
jgi:hypothetical protein